MPERLFDLSRGVVPTQSARVARRWRTADRSLSNEGGQAT